MSDPRRSHPASSFNSVPVRRTSSSQQRDEAADVTWLDFLRTAGGTVPDRQDSADRKRRRAGTSPERIPHPSSARSMASNSTGYRRPSGQQNTRIPAGASAQNAIDLISPPRTNVRMSVGSGGGGGDQVEGESRRSSAGNVIRRRSSDVVLPPWQPDSTVSQCPVCHTEFGFWYRKHHCRKCGRVVCAACSPHRITIPRQYIVQPPNPFDSDLTAHQGELRYEAALGGGEVVRVCNPCVPDPWTPDTTPVLRPTQSTDIPPRPLINRARNVRSGEVRTMGNNQSNNQNNNILGLPPPPTGFRSRSQSHQPTTGNVPERHQFPREPPRTTDFRQSRPLPPPPPPSSSRPTGHRYSHSTAVQPSIHSASSIPRNSTSPRTAPPAPRRQVREEDECPVCGEELPPGDQLREAHIQDCIATRFSSSTPATTTTIATMPPPPGPARAESTPGTVASSSTPPAAAAGSQPPPLPPSRPRGASYRPRGMALYRATEKDCSTEDGEPQECVICFEEFQPGDEMGRMECLCKFHRTCLRTWWDTKGDGSCPTHQLHE